MIQQHPSQKTDQTLGVIPARWASSRFPGKPLHFIAGKSLVQHVWDRCSQCLNLDDLVVATDDDRIAETVVEFGGNVTMTRGDHPSGTDRIAEVAEQYPHAARIINIQGDEPLIDPALIDELATVLKEDPECGLVTAANEIAVGDADIADPNAVKVVLDARGNALYFSRSQIPYPRNSDVSELRCYRHKGIYGFQRQTLLDFIEWEPTPLERCEGLEQLRALENGARIRVIITEDNSPGIDTPQQAAILNTRLSE